MDMERKTYCVPCCEVVELRLENAVLQSSVKGYKPGYGDWITNEWGN